MIWYDRLLQNPIDVHRYGFGTAPSLPSLSLIILAVRFSTSVAQMSYRGINKSIGWRSTNLLGGGGFGNNEIAIGGKELETRRNADDHCSIMQVQK